MKKHKLEMVGTIRTFGNKVRDAVQRFDGWQNPLTGLGTLARDKLLSSVFERDDKLSDKQLEGLYDCNDMAATICDTVPTEALRQGYSIQIDTDTVSGNTKTDITDFDQKRSKMEMTAAEAAEVATQIKDALEALGTQEKLVEALIWGLVFGGGALYLGADDGAADLAEPLNEESIKSFNYLNVLDKRFMMPNQWYTVPTEPKFGQPRTYWIFPQVMGNAAIEDVTTMREIHESRLIVFGGVRTTIRRKQENNGWSNPLLQRIHTILRQFGVGWDTLPHIMQDANQGIFKMDGLMDALAARDTETIQKRFALLDMSRSVVRAVVLDKEGEEFERQNFNWGGIKEPYHLLMLRVSAAARIPVTILMGQSPAGMNATGEADLRWFYDRIKSFQMQEVEPALSRLVTLITRAKDGPTEGKEPDSWSIQFKSLWTPTQLEQAKIYETTAKGDKAYVEVGVLIPEEVAINRFRPEGYSTETAIDLTTRGLLLEQQAETAFEEEDEDTDGDTDTDTDADTNA